MQTDVAIVGGGPAGLQAALTLGRIHRKAVVLDDGTYRNAAVTHMHNVLTNDGRPPGDYRAAARRELAAYDSITVLQVRADDIQQTGDTFRLQLADGSGLTARQLVLATGVRDELPTIDGLGGLWGDLAAQCPFCHAHEFSGTRIGIIGGESAAHYVAMLGPIASELVVLTNGEPLPETWQGGSAVRTEPIVTVERRRGGVRVTLGAAEGGGASRGPEHEQVSVLFVRPTLHQSAPFAAQLGLELNPSGCVRIDEFGRTSRPGVYAAGDLAHQPTFPGPMASVVMAQAMGQLAGMTAHSTLMAQGL
ncbi:NAD(P)/FAD-dependent oxidoreductase [Humibacillus xanthopallidus]|uniref:Thioredoxin reductase n=1 Tax=Humibacillus xanthopallidus TaxID=412689 RepID=A0A543HA83_9MICO|nr:NAD(P)/FAD-dependent oxidoreductase [Humibacillus xanthopallidus]TQM55235.1 thioredoxin reductase [Humibacillus xanthopallidus]